MYIKYDQNLLLLWLFLFVQIVILVGYLKLSSTWNNDGYDRGEKLPKPVSFIQHLNKGYIKKQDSLKYKNYFDADTNNEIYLKNEDVENYFLTINDTVCFKFGTDISHMKHNIKQNKSGKCECFKGYHGNDCSLPEIIWRAFIAFRQGTIIHKRNLKARRIIHMFKITHPAQIPLAAIKINELYTAVDLFIIVESNRTQYGETKPFYIKENLDKGLCKDQQHKILFTPIYEGRKQLNSLSELSWEKSQKIINNLRGDDLLIQSETSEILNSKALLFFKLFDGFSIPLQFRLKWNVYGYYFQHPNKTKQITTGSTVRMLHDVYNNDPDSIKVSKGLTVGDLNHYGGWFCDLCFGIKDILNFIQTSGEFEILLEEISRSIDEKYLEETIGDGLYVDGKTLLIMNYETRDKYYTPEYVAKNYWKFDSLMINIYNKVDYN